MSIFTDTSIKVRHRTNADLVYESHLKTENLTSSQKLKTGLKSFGIGLIIALVGLPIPILHFILVPAGLLVGLILLFRSLTFTDYLPENLIKCPQCQQNISLKTGPFKWPIKTDCNSCRSEIIIDKV